MPKNLAKMQIAVSILSLLVSILLFIIIAIASIGSGLLMLLFDGISMLFTNSSSTPIASYLILLILLLVGIGIVIALIVGLVLSFLNTRTSAIISIICNFIHLILLWYLKEVFYILSMSISILIPCITIMCFVASIYIASKTPKVMKY